MLNFEENSERIFFIMEKNILKRYNKEKLSPIQLQFNDFIYERYKNVKKLFFYQRKRKLVDKQGLGGCTSGYLC